MDPDPPSTSPFRAPPDGSPFRLEPEQPRLGILHLLVWTACVAACMAIRQTCGRSELGETELDRAVFSLFRVVFAVGSGAALGGLLLPFARRRRGLPFPAYPGETLLLASGIIVCVKLAKEVLIAVVWILFHRSVIQVSWGYIWQLEYAEHALTGLVFLVAAVRTKTRRWRALFLCLAGVCVLFFFLRWENLFLGGLPWVYVHYGVPLIPGAILIAFVLRDLLQRRTYPWTHWLGIGVELWYGAARIAYLAWRTIVGDGHAKHGGRPQQRGLVPANQLQGGQAG